MDEKIDEKVGKELYNDLSSIMSEEYEKRMLITPSYCANKLLEKGYRKESDTAKEICEKVIALYRQVMPLQKKGLFIAENAFICGVREIEKYFAEDKE